MTKTLSEKLAACLVGVLYQLEAADEELVNSDFVISLMESVGIELQELDSHDLTEFVNMIQTMAENETNEARRGYFEELPENFGLQDL